MKILIITLLGILTSCCYAIKHTSIEIMKDTIKERQITSYNDIPVELLKEMDKMGVDSSSVLNEYEARYFNFIFSLDTSDYSLFNKNVGFLGSKIDFFNDERNRFRHEESGVGGCALHVFNAMQKEETGGYDAAIVYWSKFVLPEKDVIKRLKKQMHCK